MNVITFRSCDPTEDVQKVLGCLQRMNFDLNGLAVTPLQDDVFRVRVEYSTVGTLTADTFVARVGQFYGVSDLAASSTDDDVVSLRVASGAMCRSGAV